MNAGQLLRQLRTSFRAMQWTGSSAYIFGGTTATNGHVYITPWAHDRIFELIDANTNGNILFLHQRGAVSGVAVAGKTDAKGIPSGPTLRGITMELDDTDYSLTEIEGSLVVVLDEDTSDKYGERQCINTWLSSDSNGGVQEVYEQIHSNAIETGPDDGRGFIVGTMIDGPKTLPFHRAMMLQFRWFCRTTIAKSYLPAANIKKSAATTTTITLTWDICPARFDKISQVIRYSTSSYPETSSSGTSGGTVLVTATTHQITGLVTGTTYYISHFMGFDDRWPLQGQANSFARIILSAATS